jgi:hypothetical protein
VADLESYTTRSISGVLGLSLVRRCRSFESVLKDCIANLVKRHIVIGHSIKEKMTVLVQYAGYGNRYRLSAIRIALGYDRFVRQ